MNDTYNKRIIGNSRVLRIPNNAVNENFSGVCEYIDAIVKKEKEE